MIGSLPDNVLLDIFDFCQTSPPIMIFYRWWLPLVHVCQSWRYIVFASPLRLDLQLECNADTSMKKMLDVWPSLPIIINELRPQQISLQLPFSGANIFAVLKHHDRIRKIAISSTSITVLKQFYNVIKKPYPELTDLHLEFFKKPAPVVLDTFLGGSAPCLKYFSLSGIPFPAFPKFILSFHELVDL